MKCLRVLRNCDANIGLLFSVLLFWCLASCSENQFKEVSRPSKVKADTQNTSGLPSDSDPVPRQSGDSISIGNGNEEGDFIDEKVFLLTCSLYDATSVKCIVSNRQSGKLIGNPESLSWVVLDEQGNLMISDLFWIVFVKNSQDTQVIIGVNGNQTGWRIIVDNDMRSDHKVEGEYIFKPESEAGEKAVSSGGEGQSTDPVQEEDAEIDAAEPTPSKESDSPLSDVSETGFSDKYVLVDVDNIPAEKGNITRSVQCEEGFIFGFNSDLDDMDLDNNTESVQCMSSVNKDSISGESREILVENGGISKDYQCGNDEFMSGISYFDDDLSEDDQDEDDDRVSSVFCKKRTTPVSSSGSVYFINFLDEALLKGQTSLAFASYSCKTGDLVYGVKVEYQQDNSGPRVNAADYFISGIWCRR